MLDDIALFIKLYETKSFKACAESLNMKASTLSKHITDLENTLKRSLITRTSKCFKPTEFGTYIYNEFKYIPKFTTKVLESFDTPKINSQNGVLNIALDATISYELVSLQIDKFLELNPDVQLNISYVVKLNQMPKNIDLCLATRYIAGENLDNRFIRNEKAKLYCRREYTIHYGIPSEPKELENHRIIGGFNVGNFPLEYFLFRNIKTHEEFFFDTSKLSLRVNSPIHMKKIGMASNYIFGSWDSLCYREVLNGSLIPVLPEWYITSIDFYIVTPKKISSLEQSFIDFLYFCLSSSYNDIITTDIG